MSGGPTWHSPIRGYFTARDVNCMKPHGIDLGDYNSVVANGSGIYAMVHSHQMPKGGPAWSDEWVANFKRWLDDGYPRGGSLADTAARLATTLPVGVWTYRSFRNDPTAVGNDATKALDLIFGEGTLTIENTGSADFRAALVFDQDHAMDLVGAWELLDVGPATLRCRGTGRAGIGTAGWIYDYLGYAVPPWSQGVNQREAIVGSTIRVVRHDSGNAGYVASFIILKR